MRPKVTPNDPKDVSRSLDIHNNTTEHHIPHHNFAPNIHNPTHKSCPNQHGHWGMFHVEHPYKRYAK